MWICFQFAALAAAAAADDEDVATELDSSNQGQARAHGNNDVEAAAGDETAPPFTTTDGTAIVFDTPCEPDELTPFEVPLLFFCC